MSYYLTHILLIFILFSISAISSAGETAIFSINRFKLKRYAKSSKRSEKAIANLRSKPHKFLITIMLCNELANVSGTAVATALFLDLLGNKGSIISTPIIFILLFLFCEILPKSAAMQNPNYIACTISIPLEMLSYILYIPNKLIEMIQIAVINSILKKYPKKEDEVITEGEFQKLVHIGETEGIVDIQEKTLIEHVLKFSEKKVADIMIPRERMFAFSIKDSRTTIMKKLHKRPFARIPVYKGNKANIIGIVLTKDILIQNYRNKNKWSLSQIMHPPFTIPPEKNIGKLLKEFQAKKIQIAIVTKNKTALGLICLEDILEEVFGEIWDELDTLHKK